MAPYQGYGARSRWSPSRIRPAVRTFRASPRDQSRQTFDRDRRTGTWLGYCAYDRAAAASKRHVRGTCGRFFDDVSAVLGRYETMKILVCDDKADSRDNVVEALRGVGYTPETLIDTALSDELTKLFARVESSTKGGAENYLHQPSRFDDVDILILDNNLAFLPNKGGPPLTAESIAGYIRAFTTTCYIVSLNMNLDVDFDLRYLVGDFSTRADLAINTSHLRNRALWTHRAADSNDRFCPWYWPVLDSAAQRRRDQVDFVREHLADSVLHTFGVDDDDLVCI